MKNGPYELVIPPEEYPGKLYRDRYCYEHHLVWWEEHGELPDDQEVIHHKNGDRRDNRIENLEKISVKEHNKIHKDPRKVAVLECPNCGTIFTRRKNKTHLVKKNNQATFCSRKCIGEFYGNGRQTKQSFSDNLIDIKEVY